MNDNEANKLRRNFNSLCAAYERRLTIPPAGDFKIRSNLLQRLRGTPPAQAYFLIEAITETRKLEGDICEFGVAQGRTSAMIANEISSFGDVRLHLFDSFEGLPKPTEEDQLKDDIFDLGSIDAYAGTMACPEEMVIKCLGAIGFPETRYVIHKGFIERLMKDKTGFPSKVSFAFVDFDFYEPTRVALDYLHEVSRTGAIFIVDDYDYVSTGAKTAVDQFIESRNAEGARYRLELPKEFGKFAVI